MKKWINMGRALVSGCLLLNGVSLVSANNVQVAIEGSLLTVVGDNAANSITITQTATGLTIAGQAGTTVNRQPSVVLPGIALNAAEIRMEGGNDSVLFNGFAVANDLYISLGDGNDLLQARSTLVVGANLTVEGGAGTDRIVLEDCVVFSDAYVDGGLGVLQATIAQSTFQKSLLVVSDASADSVTISDVDVAEIVSIETKGGNDTLSISSLSAFSLYATTDAGLDSLVIRSVSTLEDFGIFTGTDNDSVSLNGVVSGKSITVSLDAGADSLSGTSVSAQEDAVFEGGAGRDTIIDRGIFGGVKKDIKEFEVQG